MEHPRIAVAGQSAGFLKSSGDSRGPAVRSGVRCARQPVIILGMHRSGTGMLTKLLRTLGLFVGHKLQPDHEATFFFRLNEMILKRVHADWDNPATVRDFLTSPEAREMTRQALQADLESHRILHYLGLRNYFRHGGLSRFDRPWGWKDPHSVFPLPLWLDLFPSARLIYIVRNGVDVASSLRARALKELNRFRARFLQRMKGTTLRSRLEFAGFKGSARCLHLAGGFSLWEEYVAEAEKHLEAAANPRLIVRYEEFLNEPAAHLTQLAQFCELPEVSKETLASVTREIRAHRANAFRADPELCAFFEQVKNSPWMRRYQYAEPAATLQPAGNETARPLRDHAA